jgi:antitoxin (DNA-binding transcriptional repressor) of toxin-antitoxin stability system
VAQEIDRWFTFQTPGGKTAFETRQVVVGSAALHIGLPSFLGRHLLGYNAASDSNEDKIMAKREVAVGDFRQRATELVRQVEETKQAITITRRGVPVAELRAVTVDPEALLGSVTYLDPDLTRPVVGPEDWEATS